MSSPEHPPGVFPLAFFEWCEAKTQKTALGESVLTQKTQGNSELGITGTEMQSQGQAVSIERNSTFSLCMQC